jgi:hypothetical protein
MKGSTMSSYSLASSYSQGQLGAGTFFSRQVSSLADALPGAISSAIRGRSRSGGPPIAPGGPGNGLPEIEIKSKMPLYIGLGAGAILLIAILGKRRK